MRRRSTGQLLIIFTIEAIISLLLLSRQSVRLPGEGPLTEDLQPPGASPVVTSEVRVEEARSQLEASIPPPDQSEASIPTPDQLEASIPVLETGPAIVR